MEIAPELESFLAQVDAAVGGLGGRRIVEIGGDHASGTLLAVDHLYAPSAILGLNPAFPSRQLGPSAWVEQVGAEDSGLDDASVDAVFSSSAFEHIGPLAAVLEEMYRVLVPGGLLYSHFGPLWSTAYGHHLWVPVGGQLFTYHTVLLPPWCHLLRTRDEVGALLSDFEPDVATRLLDFVFESEEQNRLFFDDYERIFAASPFETVFLKGYDAAELAAKYPQSHSPVLHDELRARFPDRHGFLYDGITVLLRK